jgi:hypothetical protein
MSKQCDFLLMRYVPDPFRNEFVNIGVLLFGREDEYAGVRFTRDWARVRCMDPQADIDVLEAIEADLLAQLRKTPDSRQQFLHRMQDTFSTGLQLSELNALVSDAPADDLERLARTYLERPSPKRDSRLGARQRIVRRMQDAFETAGVWDAMLKRIPAAKYTHAGDPLKIDCGYRPNGVIRLFQALSLSTDPDSAKVLAFSVPALADGIARIEGAKTDVTAVIEDDLREEGSAAGFAIEALRLTSINVARVSEMPAYAERARMELRL